MENKKVVFIHSLNNYTGSPNVLAVVLRGFISRGYQVELHTSRTEGFLSGIPGVKYRYTLYHWSSNTIITLLFLILSQLQLFFRLIFKPSTNTLFYINTIVPFGAALACWLTGKNYVYHVHENMQQNKPLYSFLRHVYRVTNKRSVFVSEYLRGTALNCRNGLVVHNALNNDFIQKALSNRTVGIRTQQILMVASLRRFKGIFEFAHLAKTFPEYSFQLVLSSTENEVNAFRSEIGNIENLTVYAMQKNLHPFYAQADLLLQLSHPESWIETFGLTILEAMVYGVPAIVPNVGGPTELVDDGVNGFIVDPHNMHQVSNRIRELMGSDDMYSKFSKASIKKADQFKEAKMINQIENYVLS